MNEGWDGCTQILWCGGQDDCTADPDWCDGIQEDVDACNSYCGGPGGTVVGCNQAFCEVDCICWGCVD